MLTFTCLHEQVELVNSVLDFEIGVCWRQFKFKYKPIKFIDHHDDR